jgi:hypothetical protein
MNTPNPSRPLFGADDLAEIAPPPPPPPPAARRRGIGLGRRSAAAAVAGGLVVGGIAGGYVVSHAATAPSPSAGATAGPFRWHGGSGGPGGFGGAGMASRTEDLSQAAAVIGITEAQLQSELSAGTTIAAVATVHKVGVATVISTLVADENKEVDALVTSGRLTRAQATQLKTQTTQRVTDMVNGTMPAGHPGGPGGLPPEDAQVAGGAIGITTTQLSTELAGGKTIAAIAVEHGSTATRVINALVASENAEIDQRVSSGQSTAAQAAQEKTETTQRVTDMVNGTHLAGGPGGPGGFRGAPGPGTGPDGSAGATSA